MKYVPGLMVGQLSGKAGSTVASHNRNGSYFRTRNIPTNPNSERQQAVRNRLASASAAWQQLTVPERAAWAAYASTIVLYDRLGQPYTPTGQQAFVSINMNTFTYSGLGTITTAIPGQAPPVALVSLTPTADTTPLMSVAYTVTPLAANTKLVIEATTLLSAGITFIGRSQYRQLFITAAAAASPANVLAAWQARYGTLLADKQIGFRAYAIDSQGQASAPLSNIITVTEP